MSVALGGGIKIEQAPAKGPAPEKEEKRKKGTRSQKE